MWLVTADATFGLSRLILRLFSSDLVVNPTKMLIGTRNFQVFVAPGCSGLEGIGLILAFGVVWLFVFRNESRFPRSLLLIPIAVAVSFVVNAARIAALVLIGASGAAQIAEIGFHSQAGWIGFDLTAVGFAFATRKIRWFRRTEEDSRGENPAVMWVLPFVCLMAAALASIAMSGGFEWFYPLRVFAVVLVVLALLPRYSRFEWRVTWFGPIAGALVFLVWIVFDRSSPNEFKSAALAGASRLTRSLWIFFRVFGSSVAAPFAEELAFRGFLYRRLISTGFEAVSFRRYSTWALAVSSLLFGACHGGNWLLATFAGAVYALVMLRRGKIADAIVAHGVTNALLAAFSLR